MGLCASSALEHLEEFEQEEDEEEEEEEEEEECSYHIDSRASSTRMSYSSSRNSRNSTNSPFKTLSFDSSRSSAEVGEIGQLGSLFCKRRGRGQGRSSLVGNNSSDILSAHLTNLLSSILCKTSSDETKSPAEISFASYLSTPFIRPQGFEQHAIMMKQHDGLDAIAKSYAESAAKAAARDTFLFLNENDSSHNFQTSSGNRPDELQELQGGYGLESCVPEENDITLGEEEEEEEDDDDEEQDETDVAAAETSSEDSDPGTVDLFKPGMYYHEDELAQYTDQKSIFEFCFPATSTSSSRWASVVNAARQSAACLAATRPLQIPPTQTLKKKQGQGEVKREDEGGANLSCVPGFELRAVVPTSYKADQDDGRGGGGATSSSSAIPGCAGSCCTSAELLRESSQDQPNCCNAPPPPDILRNRRTTSSREDCRITLELQRTPPRNSEEQKDGSSTTNSQNNNVKLQDVDSGNVAQKLGCSRQGADLAPDHGVRSKEGEQDSSANVGEQLLPSSQSGEDSKNPHQGWLDCPTSCLRIRIISAGKEYSDLCSSSTRGNLIQDREARIEDEEEKEEQDPDPDSFFSFPSSPSSKLFEEVGSGHIIEQMKSTKLMQEMACRKSTLEEFQGTGFDEEELRHEAESATFGKAPLPASQATLETAAAAAASQTIFFDKKSFSQEQQAACNPAAAANSSKRFAASKPLLSTEDTSSNNPLDGHGGDESSCCESFDNDDNHHTLGIRIMRFAGKDFACFQIKKCFNGNAVADVPSSGGVTAAASASESASESGTLRNLILHGGKAVRKASSSRAKSVKDAVGNKKTNCLEQFEESTTLTSSTGKGLLLLKLGLLRRKTLGC